MKEVAHRNEQFEQIAEHKATYRAAGNPILSMDTKKKEQIGHFYRDGTLYTAAEVTTYDHDFPSFGDGVIIPHALYDRQRNHGFLHMGTTADTSEFACDSIRRWWWQHGQYDYPDATSILILCDGGGSNNSRHYLFKQDLQALVNEIGVGIRMAHYHPTALSTTRLNIVSFPMSPALIRALSSRALTSFANSWPKPKPNKG